MLVELTQVSSLFYLVIFLPTQGEVQLIFNTCSCSHLVSNVGKPIGVKALLYQDLNLMYLTVGK